MLYEYIHVSTHTGDIIWKSNNKEFRWKDFTPYYKFSLSYILNEKRFACFILFVFMYRRTFLVYTYFVCGIIYSLGLNIIEWTNETNERNYHKVISNSTFVSWIQIVRIVWLFQRHGILHYMPLPYPTIIEYPVLTWNFEKNQFGRIEMIFETPSFEREIIWSGIKSVSKIWIWIRLWSDGGWWWSSCSLD